MKNVFLTLLCLLIPYWVFAQNFKRPDSYNYSRGIEAIQNENTDEALEYLNKEIHENAKNGYAYSWIAWIREYEEEYGRALSAADKALKYIPSKDSEYIIFALSTRARIYHNLAQDDKAIADYNRAIKAAPENMKLYEDRAQLYYELEKYDLADKDYQKMISIDQGSVMGYMGLGRNANSQGRYEDAIKQFDYVIKLAPSYSSGYSFRGESYTMLKQYDNAIDDVIKALSINGDQKAYSCLFVLADSATLQLTTKLKIQAAAEPTNYHWNYCLGVVYETQRKYHNAIDYYKKAFDVNSSPITANRIADCYDECGNYEQALRFIDLAIEKDSTNETYLLHKGNILDNAGRTKEGIAVLDKQILLAPKESFGYYRRGWMKDHTGDKDGAIEDYTTAIALKPDYAYAYLNRGVLYRLKGDADLAKADFETVIRLDTVPGSYNTTQYALYYLGRKGEAIDFLNKVLEKDAKGNYYDAACLYSIMNDKAKSVEYLRKAFETGYRRFNHVRRDRDLDNIRSYQPYLDLMKEYEGLYQKELSSDAETVPQYEKQESSVPFIKENGVYKVKCNVNNLPLHFIFDTGASNVSISSVEATFMLKNDYLRTSDIIGRQNYINANGEISEGTVINLRNVDFAGLHLSNVKASVVNNQKAPLLLGLSVLEKLGKIEIDNEKHELHVIQFKTK